MKFIYKAKKGLDQTFEGSIEADNKEEVLNKLLAQGLFPVSINEETVKKDDQQQKVTRGKKLNGGLHREKYLLLLGN